MILQFISLELRDDKDAVLVAIKSTRYGRWPFLYINSALKYAPTRLRNDREVVLAAVRAIAKPLQYASPELRDDRDTGGASAGMLRQRNPRCFCADEWPRATMDNEVRRWIADDSELKLPKEEVDTLNGPEAALYYVCWLVPSLMLLVEICREELGIVKVDVAARKRKKELIEKLKKKEAQ
ncbi:unnamed protein product [Amoebophrya sp. A25]|nr:unnamed protein product [Amoebophrya sp. A25]|eukprot:GSA25T00024502001.1